MHLLYAIAAHLLLIGMTSTCNIHLIYGTDEAIAQVNALDRLVVYNS